MVNGAENDTQLGRCVNDVNMYQCAERVKWFLSIKSEHKCGWMKRLRMISLRPNLPKNKPFAKGKSYGNGGVE